MCLSRQRRPNGERQIVPNIRQINLGVFIPTDDVIMEKHHARRRPPTELLTVVPVKGFITPLPSHRVLVLCFPSVGDGLALNRVVADHESRPGMRIGQSGKGRLSMCKCVVLDKSESGRTKSGWRHPRAIAITSSIPAATVDVNWV